MGTMAILRGDLRYSEKRHANPPAPHEELTAWVSVAQATSLRNEYDNAASTTKVRSVTRKDRERHDMLKIPKRSNDGSQRQPFPKMHDPSNALTMSETQMEKEI